MDAIDAAGSYHFEMDMEFEVAAAGFRVAMPITLSGDFWAPDRVQGTVALSVGFLDVEFQMITIGETSYVTDPETGEWEIDTEETVPFGGPARFVGTDLSEIQDLAFVDEENLDGVAAYRLRGVLPAEALGEEGMVGELQVEYWVGTEDSLLRRIGIEGDLDVEDDAGLVFGGVVPTASMTLSMTLELSDFGKPVAIVAPEVRPAIPAAATSERATIQTAVDSFMTEQGTARIDALTVPTNDFFSQTAQPIARVVAEGFLKNSITGYYYTWDSTGTVHQYLMDGTEVNPPALPAPDDHGNFAADATPLLPDEVLAGSIDHRSDTDFFSFAAQAGQAFSITTFLGTLADSSLALYNTDGISELDFNDDYAETFASQLIWTALASGTYFVAVQGFDRSDVGSYTLELALLGGEAVPSPLGPAPTAAALASPTPAPALTALASPTPAPATPTPTPAPAMPVPIPVPTELTAPSPATTEKAAVQMAVDSYMARFAVSTIMALITATNDFSATSAQVPARILARYLRTTTAYCYTWDSAGEVRQATRAPCPGPEPVAGPIVAP